MGDQESVLAGVNVSHGTPVAYADLVKLDDPPGVGKNDHRYQAARIPVFTNALGITEGDILTTTGWLHLVTGESDGDYHVQISDGQDSQATRLIAEVPNPGQGSPSQPRG